MFFRSFVWLLTLKYWKLIFFSMKIWLCFYKIRQQIIIWSLLRVCSFNLLFWFGVLYEKTHVLTEKFAFKELLRSKWLGPSFFTCNVKNIRMEVNSFARNSSTWLSNVSSQTFNLIIFRWVTASIILRKRSSFRSNCWNWKLLIEIVRTKLRLRINMRTIVPVMDNRRKNNDAGCLILIRVI